MISPSFFVRLLAWTGILAATAWAGWARSELKVLPLAGSVTVERDLPYRSRNGSELKLDLYLPRLAARTRGAGCPAIVLVHGGSWIGGSKSSYWSDPRRNATRLTQHGMAVIAVDYLLGRPGKPSWPEAMEDLRESIRWTRRHAAKYGIDPGRIAVLGQSAGGHLAMLQGTEGEGEHRSVDGVSSTIQAVISLYGPTDLESLSEYRQSRRDPIFTFLGDPTLGRDPALERTSSPVLRVTNSASPMLLVHGSDDRWVPPDQARAMSRSLQRAGVLNRLVVIEGARHGFETVVESPEYVDLLPEILAFLDKVWNVSPANHIRGQTSNRASINDKNRAVPRQDLATRSIRERSRIVGLAGLIPSDLRAWSDVRS